MSINKIQAVGQYVIVIRDQTETEKNGLLLPELSLKKPNTGRILSVGEEVKDSRIKEGAIAVFHKSSGNPIELFDTELIFLVQSESHQQVLAIL